jgi:hypothetical protein
MLLKEYDRKGSVEKEKKKIHGSQSQGDWRQNKLIGGKLPVIKQL